MPRPDEPGSHASPPAAPPGLRRRVHELLESSPGVDSAGGLVTLAIVVLILLNAVAFTAETVPEIGGRYARLFALFDAVSVAIFTAEYALRLWSSAEALGYNHLPAWRARLLYALRPLMLVDLAVILPFYLAFLIGIDLRVLRVLRLFRFLKIARYSHALQTLGRVIVNERRALAGALLLMLTLLLLSSTGMYFLEREAQPNTFGSVPQAAWWGLATLTTIGYGDAVPVTALGKLFGGIVMIVGVGMFAVPIAILATGFSQEAARHQFLVTWSMVARVPLFAQLDAAAVARVMQLLHSKSVLAGTYIVRAGEEGDAMYFIASGEAAVETGDEPVILTEGDFFGEMSLVYDRPRSHTVTARTNCRLLVLDRGDFERLCHHHPEIRQHIRRVADERLNMGSRQPPRKTA